MSTIDTITTDQISALRDEAAIAECVRVIQRAEDMADS